MSFRYVQQPKDAVGSGDFYGTLFVNGDNAGDSVGFVFGFQTNRRFYSVIWRRINANHIPAVNNPTGGIRGVHIKVWDTQAVLWHKRIHR